MISIWNYYLPRSKDQRDFKIPRNVYELYCFLKLSYLDQDLWRLMLLSLEYWPLEDLRRIQNQEWLALKFYFDIDCQPEFGRRINWKINLVSHLIESCWIRVKLPELNELGSEEEDPVYSEGQISPIKTIKLSLPSNN